MGDMSRYFGNTSTSTYGNETVWIYRNQKDDSWYSISKKKKKEFIEEDEFKIWKISWNKWTKDGN